MEIVYDYVWEHSVDEVRGRVWTGAMTSVLSDKGISNGAYTPITGGLQMMGCVEQLRRGGGSTSSQWKLLKKPTIALFESAASSKYRTKERHRFEILEGQLEAAVKRIATLEHQIAILIEWKRRSDIDHS